MKARKVHDRWRLHCCPGSGASTIRCRKPRAGVQNCTEAHNDGVWDIPSSDEAYWEDGDRDGDGIACESYSRGS